MSIRLREIACCNREEFIYAWQTDENMPERFDEFNARVQRWLDSNGFILGEGTIEAGLHPPYIGETFSRMEYFLKAPLVWGDAEFPLVDLVSDRM